MLCKDLKQAVHVRKATNISELKLSCMEEWAKVPPSQCGGADQQLPEMVRCSCCCTLVASDATNNGSHTHRYVILDPVLH